jgi:hypothetical protein
MTGTVVVRYLSNLAERSPPELVLSAAAGGVKSAVFGCAARLREL